MKLRDVVTFVVGAAVGGLVATKIVSDKYEKIIKKEVDETREAYNKLRRELKEKYESKPVVKYNRLQEAEEQMPEVVMKAKDSDGENVYILDGDDRKYTKEEMREKLSGIAYDHGYSQKEESMPEDLPENLSTHINGGRDRPYPISPDDVGALPGYITRRLIKYVNGVVTEVGDLGEDVIFEVDDIVGFDNIEEHIGDYEEHMLYVRNDKYKSDYTLYECDDLYETVYS